MFVHVSVKSVSDVMGPELTLVPDVALAEKPFCPVTVQLSAPALLHVIFVGEPERTRVGLTMKVKIEGGATQLPPTWTVPEGHEQVFGAEHCIPPVQDVLHTGTHAPPEKVYPVGQQVPPDATYPDGHDAVQVPL